MIWDRMKHPFLALLAGALIFGAGKANAADVYWDDLTNGFTNGPSWAGGFAPGAADRGGVSNGGTVQITSNITIAEFFIVSPGGDFAGGLAGPGPGTVDHTGGVANYTEWLAVGRQAGGTGTEVGTYNQSVGTTVNVKRFRIADGPGSIGEYNMSGGTLSATDEGLLVGFGGTGTFTQDGGSVSSGGTWMSLGQNIGGHGTYNLNDGSLAVGTDLQVGENGTGVFNQNGGTVNSSWLRVGSEIAGAVGNYNLTNGSVDLANDLVVGENGTGTVTQSGGTMTASAWAIVGDQATGSGTYNLSGGDVNAGRFVIGAQTGSYGLVNMSGGTLNTTDSLVVSRHGGTQGGVGGGILQTAGIVNTQFVQIGGDPGTADVTSGGRYTMFGGTLNASGDINIGLNANGGTPFEVGMTVAGAAIVDVEGGLEVSRDGDGDFMVVGSAASIDFGKNLDASSVGGTARLIFGTDDSGVTDINVATVDSAATVDLNGALLLLQMVDGDPGTGLATVAQTTPGDLLLIDNRGTNPVSGLLTFDPLAGGTLDLLNEGERLVDDGALGLLNGLEYYITYQGGDGNDVVLVHIPEPTSLTLLGLGGLFLSGRRCRCRS